MPSEKHELLVEMFRVRPELAADVLEVLDFPIPEYDEVVVAPGELNNLTPTEFRADRVVAFTARKKTAFALIVEVQLRTDEQKRFSWPAYVGTLHSRLKCPLLLVVVCVDAKVAEWSGQPLVIADPGFFKMTPVVLGPGQVNAVIDVAVAERNPPLALVSTLMHLDEPEPRLRLEAAAAAVRKIKLESGELYYDSLLAVLP